MLMPRELKIKVPKEGCENLRYDLSYISHFVDNMVINLRDSSTPEADLEKIKDFLTCLTVYCPGSELDSKLIINWDDPSFSVESNKVFKHIRIKKGHITKTQKEYVCFKRVEVKRKAGGYCLRNETNAAPFLLNADEIYLKNMFFRVDEPRTESN